MFLLNELYYSNNGEQLRVTCWRRSSIDDRMWIALSLNTVTSTFVHRVSKQKNSIYRGESSVDEDCWHHFKRRITRKLCVSEYCSHQVILLFNSIYGKAKPILDPLTTPMNSTGTLQPFLQIHFRVSKKYVLQTRTVRNLDGEKKAKKSKCGSYGQRIVLDRTLRCWHY